MLGEHCKTKNMRIVLIGIGVLLAAAAAVAVIMSNQTSSFFAVENNDDGSISVAAQKAAKEPAGWDISRFQKDRSSMCEAI